MELADQMNHDTDEMDSALAPLLDTWTIIAVPVTLPSGRVRHRLPLERGRPRRTGACEPIGQQHRPARSLFITERSTAQAAELYSHLGLRPNELVSSELSTAITDGRLVVRDRNWTLDVFKAAEPVLKPEPKSEPKQDAKSEPHSRPGRITRALHATTYLATMPGSRARMSRSAMQLALGPATRHHHTCAMR